MQYSIVKYVFNSYMMSISAMLCIYHKTMGKMSASVNFPNKISLCSDSATKSFATVVKSIESVSCLCA